MANGYLMLVLHAHLPYVRHSEREFFLEENWLFEATADCYIPLARMLRGLIDEQVDFALTLSLSPTLLEMLSDGLLRARLRRHLERLIKLSEKEAHIRAGDERLGPLAKMYAERYRDTLRAYDEELGGDLVGAFRSLGTTKHVELITSSATHAYIPNLWGIREAAHAQIEGGMRVFEHHMGRRPRGFWLPECGYIDGLDSLLMSCGARYFFLETHGVLYAEPKPKYGIYSPVECPSGALAFGRDPFAAERVWSALSGYPADPVYREFFRDLGFESAHEHVIEHLSSFLMEGERAHTGIKYHRITGKGPDKEYYDPAIASQRAREHARDFMAALRSHVSVINDRYGFTPLVTAPYDAELFGHWWFEGTKWLEAVLRETSSSEAIKCVTPSAYIDEHGENAQAANPSMSSWGEGGYSAVWSEPDSGAVATRLALASGRLRRVLSGSHPSHPEMKQVMDQAVRELMLAQSSDWSFMLSKRSHTEYAYMRLAEHLSALDELLRMAEKGRVNKSKLREIETLHPLMRNIGCELFSN